MWCYMNEKKQNYHESLLRGSLVSEFVDAVVDTINACRRRPVLAGLIPAIILAACAPETRTPSADVVTKEPQEQQNLEQSFNDAAQVIWRNSEGNTQVTTAKDSGFEFMTGFEIDLSAEQGVKLPDGVFGILQKDNELYLANKGIEGGWLVLDYKEFRDPVEGTYNRGFAREGEEGFLTIFWNEYDESGDKLQGTYFHSVLTQQTYALNGGESSLQLDRLIRARVNRPATNPNEQVVNTDPTGEIPSGAVVTVTPGENPTITIEGSPTESSVAPAEELATVESAKALIEANLGLYGNERNSMPEFSDLETVPRVNAEQWDKALKDGTIWKAIKQLQAEGKIKTIDPNIAIPKPEPYDMKYLNRYGIVPFAKISDRGQWYDTVPLYIIVNRGGVDMMVGFTLVGQGIVEMESPLPTKSDVYRSIRNGAFGHAFVGPGYVSNNSNCLTLVNIWDNRTDSQFTSEQTGAVCDWILSNQADGTPGGVILQNFHQTGVLTNTVTVGGTMYEGFIPSAPSILSN